MASDSHQWAQRAPIPPPPLVVDRAKRVIDRGEVVKNRRNASSTRGGCQRQALVFDAKREYVTKMVSSTRGGVSSARHRQGGCQRQGGVNDKGGGGISKYFLTKQGKNESILAPPPPGLSLQERDPETQSLCTVVEGEGEGSKHRIGSRWK